MYLLIKYIILTLKCNLHLKLLSAVINSFILELSCILKMYFIKLRFIDLGLNIYLCIILVMWIKLAIESPIWMPTFFIIYIISVLYNCTTYTKFTFSRINIVKFKIKVNWLIITFIGKHIKCSLVGFFVILVLKRVINK